jgi:WS/DGAT/MGAT family acyltransferase
MGGPANNELMSSVDYAWLEMDEPRNPMVVAGLIEFDGKVDIGLLKTTIVERLLRYPRFRQRADDTHSPPLWIRDDELDLDYHVHVVRLRKDTTEKQLRDAVAVALVEDLDRGRPLWRMFVYHGAGRPTTVLFRAHHALADGIAMVKVLLNCTDAAVRKKPALSILPHEHGAHAGPLGGLIDRLEVANQALDGLRAVAVDDLRHPGHLLAQLRAGGKALAAVRRVLSLPEDNPPVLKQALSGRRAVAWITDLPFAPVRRLASELGVKINDVFIGVLCCALGRELRERGIGMSDAQNLRISIPVNLRNDDDGELGNHFGLVLLDLPVGLQDPLRCLSIVAQRMQHLKDSPEAQAVLMSLAAAGHLPVPWEKKLVRSVGGKAVAVVSNLPGPKRPVRIAGARVRNLVFWPPQAGGIGLGVSLFSYAGRVSLGVSADVQQMPQPQRLLDAFCAELDELQSLARSSRAEKAAAAPRKRATRKRVASARRSGTKPVPAPLTAV